MFPRWHFNGFAVMIRHDVGCRRPLHKITFENLIFLISFGKENLGNFMNIYKYKILGNFFPKIS